MSQLIVNHHLLTRVGIELLGQLKIVKILQKCQNNFLRGNSEFCAGMCAHNCERHCELCAAMCAHNCVRQCASGR